MGRIRILSDQVANQIAAGEVVERPASVVKELLENAIDAGATRIRVEVEAGGRKLIRITDNGVGMVRDDALLAFERHATSKLRTSDDLLAISTLGFRGEALPSIASVSRLVLETRAAAEDGTPTEDTGTLVEIAGGSILRADPCGRPAGTTITVRDLFFNTPARRKFLKTEQTELAHVAALVTHYALAHPSRHFELHTGTQALLVTPAVQLSGDRLFQIFGDETSRRMLPVAAESRFRHAGLPELPPWKRDAEWEPAEPGHLRISGFVSKPELQKLNRNSIYIFVNQRLIRDRLVLHALTESYRNIIPPTSFPVVLLFLDISPEEVDVNVHPAKTEVRFRQPAFVHDFLRDTVRAALIAGRPAASFAQALAGSAEDGPASSLTLDVSPLPGEPSPNRVTRGEEHAAGSPPPGAGPAGYTGNLYAPGATSLSGLDDARFGPNRASVGFPAHLAETTGPQSEPDPCPGDAEIFALTGPSLPAAPGRLSFRPEEAISVGYPDPHASDHAVNGTEPHSLAQRATSGVAEPIASPELADTLRALSTLRPLGQLRDSFILATNEEGLWIIDQHVAHERVLFEKVLRERHTEAVQRQRLLMPLLIDLLPEQMIRFAELAGELERNGFEAEPFGPRTLAVRAAPTGLEGRELELALEELLAAPDTIDQTENAGTRARRIAASIACHAAIKINTPLDPAKITWLIDALSRTEHPTSCPHGRPIALKYSHRDIARAFQRT